MTVSVGVLVVVALAGVAGTRVGPRRARVAAALLLIVVSAEAAAAASSVTSGWWTTAVTPPPPDVPSDGLLVQSSVTPTAYAAVSFGLADGERADSLTLTVAEGSVSNPATTLRLCPLTEPIQPAQGGAADDAPDYDCRDAVDAAPDQGRYVFDVSVLARARSLAVAVLPTGPFDRVVLEGPDVGSLSTIIPPPRTAPPSTTVPTTVAPAPAGPGFATPRPTVSQPPSPSTVPDALADLPTVEEEAGPTIDTEDVAQRPVPLEPSAGSTTSAVAQAALAGAVVAALVLWLTAGALAHGRARRAPHRALTPT